MIFDDLGIHKPVFMVGMNKNVSERMRRLGVLDHFPQEHVFALREEALKQAANLLAVRP